MTEKRNLSSKRKTGRAGHKTSAARLAAVQALYEIEVTGARVDQVIDDFVTKRWRSVTLRDPDALPGEGVRARLPNPNPDVLRQLIVGVGEGRGDIDAKIEAVLTDDWTMERLDMLMRCLLRTCTYETLHMPITPNGTVVNEYVDLAKTFFDKKDAEFAEIAICDLVNENREKA